MTWLGSKDVNLLLVLSEIIEVVKDLSSELSLHTHVPGSKPSPGNEIFFVRSSVAALVLEEKIRAITALS